jgi:hypothetical protein
MPIKFDIRPDHSIAIVVHDGVVLDTEFLTTCQALYAHDRFDYSYDLLVDLRRTDSSARSTKTLKGFADFMRNQYANVESCPKVAVVATENISFGLARMYEAFSDTVPWDFMVFREISDALVWLGLDGDFLNESSSAP